MKTIPAHIVLCLMISFFVIFPGTAPADQKPEAVVLERVFNFGSVWEGDTVDHDFIIKNNGSAPLEILKLDSDCGCTAASGEKQIPPGGEGKISLSFSSNSYGGHDVRKITKVHTNDPSQPLIGIELIGQVKTFALLDPGHIELTGKAGENLTAAMTITPVEQEMDFKIAQVTAKDSKNIRFEVKRNDQTSPARYELIVENIKKEPGRYVDLITIWTDTSRKIPIRVFGNIFQ